MATSTIATAAGDVYRAYLREYRDFITVMIRCWLKGSLTATPQSNFLEASPRAPSANYGPMLADRFEPPLPAGTGLSSRA